jgi:hypothetical protein
MILPGRRPQSKIVSSSYWYTLEDDCECRANGEYGDENYEGSSVVDARG